MVDFTIAPDLEERTPTVPPELAKLLKTEKKLAKWYEGLSEPIRWEIAKWIDGSEERRGATAESGADRRTADVSEEGEKGVAAGAGGGLSRVPAARQGWDAMTKAQRRSNLLAVFLLSKPGKLARSG